MKVRDEVIDDAKRVARSWIDEELGRAGPRIERTGCRCCTLQRTQRGRAERDDRPSTRHELRRLRGNHVALTVHGMLADVVCAERLERAVPDVQRDGRERDAALPEPLDDV